MVLSFLLTTVPGLYAWWDGRRLRRQDEAALAELWTAHTGRVLRVLLISWVVTLVVARGSSSWVILGAGIGLLIGLFPARRRILEETWGLSAYLDHHARFILAMFGPWVLLLAVPAVLAVHRTSVATLGSGLVLLILLWSVGGAHVLLGLFGATELRDPELMRRFSGVLEKARCRTPTIYRAGAPGGRWINAFAIPTPRKPAVLLTDGLLAALTADETTAIFAHEVAHLEEITPPRWTARVLVAPLFAVLLVLLLLLAGPEGSMSSWMLLAWPALCAIVLIASLGHSQAQESRSDVRATELCGDAEALIRGLTRIHALMRQPRRMALERESHASHPSLARRIQAIRNTQSDSRRLTPTKELEAVLVASAAEDGTFIVMHSDHVLWLEGVPADEMVQVETAWRSAARVHALKYGELVELRLAAPAPDRRELVAVDRAGARRIVPIDAEDVARVQKRLDEVDVQMARAARGPGASPLTSSGAVRLVAAAAILAGLLPPFSWALSIAGAIALVWPAQATLVAAGLAGLLSAAAGWRAGFGGMAPHASESLLACQVGASLLLLLMARLRTRVVRRERPEWTQRSVGALLVLAALTAVWELGLARGLPPAMQVHVWARSVPTSLVLLASTALALLTISRSRRRVAAAALLVIGAVLALAGSSAFRRAFTRDLLREAPQTVALDVVTPTLVRSRSYEGAVESLMLSPSGSRLAVQLQSVSEGRVGAPSAFVVEGPAELREVPGFALGWMHDAAVVTLWADSDDLIVRQNDLETGKVIEARLPSVIQPELFTDEEQWWVCSRGTTGKDLVEHAGRFGSESFETRQWPMPAMTDDVIVYGMTDGRGGGLFTSTRYGDGSQLLAGFDLLGMGDPTQIWTLRSNGLQPLGETWLSSMIHALGPSRYLIAATADRTTELWKVDAAEGHFTPWGRLPSWYWCASPTAGLVFESWQGPWFVVDPDRGRLIAIPAMNEQTCSSASPVWRQAVAFRHGILAVARGSENTSTVELFRVEG